MLASTSADLQRRIAEHLVLIPGCLLLFSSTNSAIRTVCKHAAAQAIERRLDCGFVWSTTNLDGKKEHSALTVSASFRRFEGQMDISLGTSHRAFSGVSQKHEWMALCEAHSLGVRLQRPRTASDFNGPRTPGVSVFESSLAASAEQLGRLRCKMALDPSIEAMTDGWSSSDDEKYVVECEPNEADFVSENDE